MYLRESRHTGEPLPILTLAQLIAHAQTAPGYVHLQGVTPDFTKMVVEDHYCRSFRCVDHFVPLFDSAHPGTQRVPVLSFITILPGDVNEARHPFNLRDPVMEGKVSSPGLSTNQVHNLRASGVLVDERTVLFERKALQGKVPPADGLDVLVPWFIGLPVALVTGLIAFVTRRPHEK
ncbi:hypothetical protein GCM10022631_08580 [Deinococcus rubellus]